MKRLCMPDNIEINVIQEVAWYQRIRAQMLFSSEIIWFSLNAVHWTVLKSYRYYMRQKLTRNTIFLSYIYRRRRRRCCSCFFSFQFCVFVLFLCPHPIDRKRNIMDKHFIDSHSFIEQRCFFSLSSSLWMNNVSSFNKTAHNHIITIEYSFQNEKFLIYFLSIFLL